MGTAFRQPIRLFLTAGLLLWTSCCMGASVEIREGPDAAPGRVEIGALSGFYSAPMQVRIESSVPGARIYFTTNGALPTLSNRVSFTNALLVTTTTVLRAAAFNR